MSKQKNIIIAWLDGIVPDSKKAIILKTVMTLNVLVLLILLVLELTT